MTKQPNSDEIYSNLEIDEDTVVGNRVTIGYPDKEKIKKALHEKIPFNKISTEKVVIGSRGTIRDGAIIYERVKIGDDVQTGHSIQIREDVVIGNNCIIGTKCVIENNVTIGNNVCLQTGSFVCPNAVIKDNVTTGPYVVFLDNKYLDYKLSSSEGPTVESNVKIGGNVTILPGIVLGENSIIGAGSVVTKNVEPNTVVVGNPAKKIKRNHKL